MEKKMVIKKAAIAAFPHTVPIFAGFTFLGIAYGIYMRSLGFSAVYPSLMSLTIFAGSMEFVAANFLIGAFHPLNALFLTIMVNARHIFYGISMLDKYNNTGKKKWYLIFGMCDESFSINCTTDIPEGIDKGWFMFFVTLFNHMYWFLGATIGGVFGNLMQFSTEGLDFVMTALFIVIFINQWQKEKIHDSTVCGIGLSVACLMIFGESNFILASMLAILIILTVLRKSLEKKVDEA
ncbi:branched-chain amino acid transport protein AzlC [Clostridium polyendosporum]|uniref:Branched-chain amino acid transport protein AzlC n=1 Tax=Clostridium polyendosporum TaxID=69208 RepID=A0A919RXW7_9CLOT|nr:azaleucine resistance protein AzlC [Clostridium polyendosporum]GIM28386.1 branched-chain amino acid transport protein AzlC [Clostridium polyendosporum]